jgi:glucose/arabinose dehydrogenase
MRITLGLALGASALASATLYIGCTDEETAGGSSTKSAGPGGTTGGGNPAGGGVNPTGGGNGAGGGGGGPSGPTHANCAPAEGTPGGLKLTMVADNLIKPVLLTYAFGDEERMYVAEQGGKIVLLKGGQATTFLDISGPVLSGGERGLLGLAFHPDYKNNGRFFVHYSDQNGDTALAEYRRSADNPDVADPMQVGPLLISQNQPYPNHNGGSIEFSPVDRFLYFGLGDGGLGGDPLKAGQDLNTLLAKILRIDVDKQEGGKPYGIPPNNMPGGLPEIWDSGLRNPWRFAFDPCTGDLYIGDVGQNKWEEIDVEKAGDGRRNYGWNVLEGAHNFAGGPSSQFTAPAVEYSHNGGDASVTGGYVYRGHAIPWLRGTYFYGDYETTQIWSFEWKDGAAANQQERTMDLDSLGVKISSFGQDDRGEVYVVDHAGAVYRIDAE